MPDSPMRNHNLGIAARYNDADAEEHGLEGAITRAGLDLKNVYYLAEQRALRVMFIEEGRYDLLGNKSQPFAVSLTRAQKEKLVLYTSAILDGILIGWRAQKMEKENG